MPTVMIKTNATIEQSTRPEILRATSRTVSQMLGKPEGYVMVILEQVPDMLFGGDPAPLAYLELKSLGLPEDRGATYSATLCDLIEEQLGVAPNRVYIELSAPPRHLFGFDGGTF